MRRFGTFISMFLVVALVLAWVAFVAFPAAAGRAGTFPGAGPAVPFDQYIPGQVVVGFEPGVDAPSRERIAADAGGATVLGEIGPPGGESARVLALQPGVSVGQAVEELSSRPDVVYAEPNYIYHATFRPDDPSYGSQWGYRNTGQSIEGSTGTAGADIDMEEAWDIEQGFSNQPTVAIVDTGCDFTHPDQKSKLLSNGYNYAGITQSKLNYQAPAGQFENWYFAQSIKGTGGQLTHIGIAVQKVGNPPVGGGGTGNIYVGVATSLDPPDGAITYYTITPSEVTTAGSEIYKALPTPVTLTNGATYYIKIAVDNTDPGLANYYNLYYNYSALSEPVYADGVGWFYNTTQGWQQGGLGFDDFYFRTNPNGKPRDDGGHGTHCAGIAAAVTDNGVGVAGTCPGARVLPVKVLDSAGSGSNSAISNGIRYAADHGADIISMSLGGSSQSTSIRDACTYAYNKGCTLFAAVGNDGNSEISYPAGYDHVIGVAATTNKDKKADFSQYNSSVDVSAPGKDIYATLPTYPVTSNLEGYSLNYDFLSGTSMACPMAAGLGALVFSQNPGMSNDEIEQRLESTADDLGDDGRDDKFGWGRINAARALGGGSQPTWYLAEGTTAWGFQTYVSVENPNSSAAIVQVTYMTDTGQVVGPAFSMPAMSQSTIFPRDTLGERDFSTKVECTNDLGIAVDRTMSWNAGTPFEEGHSAVGITAAAKTWYLPEGSTNWGFECFLLVQNPNSSVANCTLTYMIQGKSPVDVSHQVPANGRATFPMATDIGAEDASIKVVSDLPVIPERAMYRNDRREGHDSTGTTTPAYDYYLAEGTTAWGFTTYVLIQNPNDQAADVTITYMTSAGPQVQPAFQMAANSRQTMRVNDVLAGQDCSTLVHGSLPVIAERAMYWDAGAGESCHDSIGMAQPHVTFYLPDGETTNGRETYTLVQNPNDGDVAIEIQYLCPNGVGNITVNDTVPGNSRKTFNMLDAGLNGRASVLVRCTTEGGKIMVERAMYWNSRGAGTDTIGGSSG
ncbi:MAG: S8 family serine peptidase [Actinomycetota bacterium]